MTPVEKYGKDHWSLLAYIECLCVDGTKGVGKIDMRKMRCNEQIHPLLVGNSNVKWREDYCTRLAGFFDYEHRNDIGKCFAEGFLLKGHDDWCCLEDLHDAGIIEIITLENGFVKMTEFGCDVAAKLRRFKALGKGNYADFKLTATS